MPLNLDQVFAAGDFAEAALENALRRQDDCLATGDKKGRAMALITSAEALVALGRLKEAQTAVAQAKTVCSEISFEEGRAAALNTSVKLQIKLASDDEELVEFVDTATDAIRRFHEIGHRKGEAVSTLTLSRLYLAMHRAEPAVKYAKTAHALFVELRDTSFRLQSHHMLKDCYMAKQHPDRERALQEMHAALALAEAEGDRAKMATCMHSIAEIEARGNSFHKALASLKESRRLFAEVRSDRGQAIVLATLVDLYCSAGMYVEAVTHGKDWVTLCHKAGDNFTEGMALVKLGKIMLESAHYDKATQLAEAAQAVFAGVGNTTGTEVAQDLLDTVNRAKASEEIGRTLYKVADLMHVPTSLIIDPNLNKRMGRAYVSFHS
mmetsp:Transcript_131594/g.256357  ORF Transcript_131594/g.256357 Transcript_131594/m.256357 type:complete len:380 (-) Transcript_131594:75-1214(-)